MAKVFKVIAAVAVGVITYGAGIPLVSALTFAMATYSVWNSISKKKKTQSPTYGFQSGTTQCSNLLVRPTIYGHIKSAGNIIYRRLSSDGKTCYALVAFADGEISKFSNIRINDFALKKVNTNKITNGNFETSPLSGWTDGTKISITRDTTNPITGTASGKIAIASGIAVNDMVKYAFSIDAGDVSTDHLFTMDFKTIDTSSGKNPKVVIQISIHDGTSDIFSTVFTNQGKIEAYFTTTASTNYELRFKVIQVNTDDIRTTDYYIDNIVIGKQEYNTTDLPDCSVSTYTGNGTQTIDTRVEGSTNAERAAKSGGLKYDAYLALTVKASANVNTDFNVTAEVFGKKVRVYSDTTTYTTIYSNNPAWCILDYLTCYNTGWLSHADCDIQSFIDAAAVCDASVNGRARYTLNYIIDEKKSRLDWLLDLCVCCNGYFTYQLDKIGFSIDSTGSSVQSFDSDNIIAGSEEFHALPSEQRYDIVKVQYIEPNQNWAMVFATAEADTWQNDIPNVLEITAYGVTNFEQASRLAWFYLNLSVTCPKFITFKTSQEGLDRTVGDLIDITSTFMGYSAKVFRIIGMTEAENGQIQLACREYNADLYTDEMGSAEPVYDVSTLTPPIPINLNDVDADSFVKVNSGGTGFTSQDASTHRGDLLNLSSSDANKFIQLDGTGKGIKTQDASGQKTALAAANVGGNATQTFKVLAGTGANDAVPYGQFVRYDDYSGYIKLPNGAIIQWSNAFDYNRTHVYRCTWALTFPNNCYSMVANGTAANDSSCLVCCTRAATTSYGEIILYSSSGTVGISAWAMGN